MMAQSFLYFGYGSNLLRQRLQLRNPTAQFVSVGELKVSAEINRIQPDNHICCLRARFTLESIVQCNSLTNMDSSCDDFLSGSST